MSKSKIGKCRRRDRKSFGLDRGYEPWFRARRRRNRIRNKMAKLSRKINRRRK